MDERQNSQNNKLIPAVLVLEGGATRGVFTSGVLDFLMEKDFYTTDVIGVSAGGPATQSIMCPGRSDARKSA